MNEKISVLIPVFNREKYIGNALRSICRQTYKNLEILIYNDGSTDRTVDIIKKYQQKDDRIILIDDNENKGVAYARNQLLLKCTGNYAIWQDSDDISNINRIAIQSQYIKQCALIFTYWAWLHFYNRKWVIRKRNTNTLAFATLLFPVDKEILFDSNIKLGGEDWNWIKKMEAKYQTIIVPKLLYYVRYHEDRIGKWKIKLRDYFTREQLSELSYKAMIEQYHKRVINDS